MRRRVIARAAVALAAFSMAVGGLVAVSSAAGAVETSEVVTSRISADFVRKIVLELPEAELSAGQPRYFFGQYGARSDWGMLQGAQIRCTSDGDTYTSVNTTMDHPGEENGNSSVRVVAVRWLFTPPSTGTYTCSMNGFATTTNQPEGKFLRVVAGDRTMLRMEDSPKPGGEEWLSDGTPRIDVDKPATTKREDVAEVMRNEWTASDNATTIRVRAGVEASRVSTGGNSPFVARTQLIVTQLNANGGACAPRVTDTETTTWDVHHKKVHHGLDVPVSTGAGCTRDFAIRTLVQYLKHPNHPETRRHGGQVENGVYSNTIAMNG